LISISASNVRLLSSVQMTWSGLTIWMFASAWMSAGGDGAGLVGLDAERDRLALVRDDEDLLQVEHDLGDVLDDAVDALELVVHPVDLDRGDGGPLDRAQEHAAQRVADGVAVARFKGLGDELGVGRRGAVLDLGEFGGEFEFSEAFWHGVNSYLSWEFGCY
jgi:hypothetical protein